MDWIEVGCFDALERKYLKSITLGIYLDAARPQELVEAYTFDVTYQEDGRANLKMTATAATHK